MREYRIISSQDAANLGMPLSEGKTSPWVCVAAYSSSGKYQGMVGWFYRKETAEKVIAKRQESLVRVKAGFDQILNNPNNLRDV